jgi:hypothetical protein
MRIPDYPVKRHFHRSEHKGVDNGLRNDLQISMDANKPKKTKIKKGLETVID